MTRTRFFWFISVVLLGTTISLEHGVRTACSAVGIAFMYTIIGGALADDAQWRKSREKLEP